MVRQTTLDELTPQGRLEMLRQRQVRLEARWERDVRFAGPAAPNKELNACNAEIWKLEDSLKK